MEKNKKFVSLLATSQDPGLSGNEKQSNYAALASLLHDTNNDEQTTLLKGVDYSLLESLLLSDIFHTQVSVSQAALQTLGLCLHSSIIVNNLQDHEMVISTLCEVIMKTTDKTCCTRGLWCLSKQELATKSVQNKLSEILEAIEHGQCKKNFQSLTVEYEALCATIRLLEQVPDEMEVYAPRWGKLVYPLVLHDAPKIRQQAMVAMEMGMAAMVNHRDEIIRNLLPDLKPDPKSDQKSKSLLVSQMIRLMGNKLEIHVLKVWSLYIRLLGKAIHHGSLINTLLPIVEQGFKNANSDVKVAAYQAWKELIDNFGLNKDILSDQKRIKLLMQVFRINNARQESVALEKLSVWWHFVCALKENASVYFDMVCVPLLQYAISGQVNPAGVTPGKTPTRTSLSSVFKSPITPGSLSSSPHTFCAVQHKGCEMLAHVLGKAIEDPNNPGPLFTTVVPEHDIITGPAFFIKHHTDILDTVRQCITTLGDQIEDSLLHHIWFATVAHVKNTFSCCIKRDLVDVLQCTMQTFQKIVESQSLSPEKLLKLLEGLLCLPSLILSSSSYSVGGSVIGGPTIMQGNAAIFLLRCQFNHRILERGIDDPLFYTIYDKLLTLLFSQEASGLISAENVIDLLSSSSTNIEKLDSLIKLWMSLANSLNSLILKTGEINQSGGLEHDFSCLLDVLLFPVTHLLSTTVTHVLHTSMMKCWSKLYNTFSRLAALVSTASANSSCQELCKKIVSTIPTSMQDEMMLSGLSQVIVTVIDAADFSSLSQPSHFGFGSSPVKYGDTKESHLSNLSGLVRLTKRLVESVCSHCEHPDNELFGDTKKAKPPGLGPVFSNLLHVIEKLFTHVPTATMIASLIDHLAAPLGQLFDVIGRKNRRGVTPNTGLKAEKLWQDIATSLQGKYSGPYDSHFLEKMTPLLQVNFLHPRQKIKSQTLILWNATFARGPPLTYPEDLKPVLTKVKAKGAILLPGWNASDILSISETPSSMMSQAESQAPFPNVIGIAISPHKAAGSFMDKVVQNIESSPLKSPSERPPTAKSPKTKKLKLSINEFKDDDFVVIKSSTKKHVLTSHQKEVLKERSTIPALYSNVDASQDVSMMAKFITTESQMSMSNMSSPSPTPTPITEITPFPFSKEALKNQVVDNETLMNPTKTKTGSGSPSRGSSRRRSVRFAKSNEDTEKENLTDSDEVVQVIKPQSFKDVIEIEDSEMDSDSILDKHKSKPVPMEERNGSISDQEPLAVSEPKSMEISDVFSADSQFFKVGVDNNERSSLVTESPRRSRRSNMNKSSQDSSADRGKPTRSKDSDKSKPESQELKRTPSSSLLDNITDETVPEKPAVTRESSLQILAEESQQVALKGVIMTSPGSMDAAAVVVEETPAKDENSIITGDVELCSKSLFIADKLNVVPDSQPEPKQKSIGLVPYSQTQKSDMDDSEFAELLSGKESPFEQVKTEVDVTPPRSQQPQLDLTAAALSPVVTVHRMSQEEVLTYSPKLSGSTRLSDFAKPAKGADSAKRRRGRPSKYEKTDVNVSQSTVDFLSQESKSSSQSVQDKTTEPISDDLPLASQSEKLPSSQSVTETDKENVFIVELHPTLEDDNVPEVSDKDGPQNMDVDMVDSQVTQCAQQVNTTCVEDSVSVSQIAGETDSDVMEVDSGTFSPKPRTTRSRKTPQWLNNMELTGSGKKKKRSNSQDSDSDCGTQSQEGRRGQRSRRASQASLSSLQTQPPSTQESSDSQRSSLTNKLTPELALNAHSTLVTQDDSEEDIFCSQDAESVKKDHSAQDCADSQDKKEDVKDNSILESQTQDMKDAVINKKHSVSEEVEYISSDEVMKISPAQTEIVIESSQNCSISNKTEEKVDGAHKEKTLLSDELYSSSNNKVDSISDDEVLSNVRQTLNKAQETLLETNSIASQESIGFELTADTKNMDENPSVTKDNKSLCHSSDDDEPLATLKTSTPVSKKSKMSLLKKSKNRVKSPRVPSPITRSLRSTVVNNLRTRSLNRSVDSAKRTQQKKKNVRRVTKDDTAAELLKTVDPAESIQADAEAVSDEVALKHVHNGILAVDDATEQLTQTEQDPQECISAEQSDNVPTDQTTGKSIPDEKEDNNKFDNDKKIDNMHLQGAVNNKNPKIEKFVSPLRSPPRRGKLFGQAETEKDSKLFNMPETPPSHKKHPLLSRASLILQRAKMSIPTPEPLQRGRGPLTATRPSERGRPGILKSPHNHSPNRPGAMSKLAQKHSPPGGAAFRTIHLPRIYSPSASPSAGILRKRKLSIDYPTDSPSPPSKQRRVCFNDNIQTREIPSAQKLKLKARMVGRGSPKPVNRCLDMPQQGGLPPSPLVDSASSKTTNREEKFITKSLSKGRVLDMRPEPENESELSETQGSIQATPTPQLDCEAAVCPGYISCQLPVDLVLPQLTSSTWSFGLGQLVRSMNITTIGHLSALTEQQINNLPIKSPKVVTVRDVLNTVMVGVKIDDEATREKLDEENPLPSGSSVQVLQLSDLSPSKDPSFNCSSTEVCDPDLETHDLLDEIRQLDNSMKSTPPSSPEPEVPARRSAANLLTDLGTIGCDQQTLSSFSSGQLMQILAQLNSMTSQVVMAMKDKCPQSPENPATLL